MVTNAGRLAFLCRVVVLSVGGVLLGIDRGEGPEVLAPPRLVLIGHPIERTWALLVVGIVPLVVRFGLVLDVGSLASRKSISRPISARASFLSLARVSRAVARSRCGWRGRLKSRQRSPLRAET
jgi:hypothetical protein